MINARRYFYLFIASIIFIAATGCGENMKREIGLGKQSPDEYQVVTSKPLTVPPNFELPSPGEETQTQTGVESPLFEEDELENNNLTKSDKDILLLSGIDEVDPKIRETMNNDSTSETVDKSLLDKILDGDTLIGSSSGQKTEVVDAQKERQRVNEQLQQGESISGQDVPTITRAE